MPLARSRPLFFLAFIVCALVISASLFLEYRAGLEPCALCIVQRVFMFVFGTVALVAYVHAPQLFGWRVYSSIMLLCATAGAATAWRQVWLQDLTAQNPMSCVPGFEYLFRTLPWSDAFARLFMSGIDCSQVSWTALGMSLAEWSLLAFIGLILLTLYQLCQRAPARFGHHKSDS